ncbi:Phosphotransferase enzyme family protein [Friedmanniella luteola]|uniref:Phosphotransferase enzyme family protein n=1 Tax=Friedmanniella luteola TaxID=546871 RepID=A0A1H1ZJI7_9ACTN|nr:phosphotransferase [Friedmanniella luteola]SDT34001.1 Phosphotransferase enzyme family protein [Friedmanniella luteola]
MDGGAGAEAYPRQPEELTAGWLTERLRASGALPEGRVAGFGSEPLHPERGMTGVLVRLRLTYDGAAPGAPATLVAKFSSPDPYVRALVHSLGYVEREVRFYRELAADTPVRTPRCHAAAVDLADGAAVLLLEDLAPADHGDWLDGATVADLRLVLDAIAAVHVAWWEDPRIAAEDWLELRGPLSVPHLHDLVDATWPTFLARLSVPVTAEIEQAGALLSEHLEAVAGYLLLTPPRTLVHQDLDGPNLFFPEADGDRSVAVIDWQAATRGRPAVDVAWLLAGSCVPEQRRAAERELLRGYHRRLVALGTTGYPFERLWDDYRLALLLPAARLAGAVGVQVGPRGGFWDVVFPRYAQAIADLEVGALLAAGDWGPSAAC